MERVGKRFEEKKDGEEEVKIRLGTDEKEEKKQFLCVSGDESDGGASLSTGICTTNRFG